MISTPGFVRMVLVLTIRVCAMDLSTVKMAVMRLTVVSMASEDNSLSSVSPVCYFLSQKTYPNLRKFPFLSFFSQKFKSVFSMVMQVLLRSAIGRSGVQYVMMGSIIEMHLCCAEWQASG